LHLAEETRSSFLPEGETDWQQLIVDFMEQVADCLEKVAA
jgi:hypothetical protein